MEVDLDKTMIIYTKQFIKIWIMELELELYFVPAALGMFTFKLTFCVHSCSFLFLFLGRPPVAVPQP